jgi:osmotically inducible lipoprotein OsmB
MQKSLIVFAILSTTLAGCMQDPASRGMAGAAAGALVADALDENMLAGAALGGMAGLATCGIELGLPPCNSGY